MQRPALNVTASTCMVCVRLCMLPLFLLCKVVCDSLVHASNYTVVEQAGLGRLTLLLTTVQAMPIEPSNAVMGKHHI